MVKPVRKVCELTTCPVCGGEYIRNGWGQRAHQHSEQHQAALAASKTEEEQSRERLPTDLRADPTPSAAQA